MYRRCIGNGKSPRVPGGTGLSRDFGKNFWRRFPALPIIFDPLYIYIIVDRGGAINPWIESIAKIHPSWIDSSGERKRKRGWGWIYLFPNFVNAGWILYFTVSYAIFIRSLSIRTFRIFHFYFLRGTIFLGRSSLFLFSLSILIKIEHLSRRNPRNSIVSRIPRPKIIILQSTSNNSNHRSARYLNKIPKRLHSSFSSPKWTFQVENPKSRSQWNSPTIVSLSQNNNSSKYIR